MKEGRRSQFSGSKGMEMSLPFLLQGSEVLLEGRADLAQQLHQRMAQEAGIGWLRVEGVGSRSGAHIHKHIYYHYINNINMRKTSTTKLAWIGK